MKNFSQLAVISAIAAAASMVVVGATAVVVGIAVLVVGVLVVAVVLSVVTVEVDTSEVVAPVAAVLTVVSAPLSPPREPHALNVMAVTAASTIAARIGLVIDVPCAIPPSLVRMLAGGKASADRWQGI